MESLLKMSSRSLVACICRQQQSRMYKSMYSLDKVYPNSKLDFSASPPEEKISSEKFTGFIPTDDLIFKYSRSSGPGGQNVNKVNTKVQVRFHVPSASWIPDSLKSLLMQKEANKINKEGFLIVSSDRTRKQLLNQADCMEKIRSMIWSCQKEEYTPSQEELDTVKQRLEKAKAGILVDKRKHSMKKKIRSVPGMYDV